MEKAKYSRELKKLIMKYHPDRCGNKSLAAAYNEITVGLNVMLDRLKNSPGENSGSGEKIPDGDYACYKAGMRYYRNIHPDQLYKRNADRTYRLKNYSEQLRALNKIFISFDLAEYFFGRLVREYPGSSWRGDAEDKLQLLKKLYKKYEARGAEKNPRIIHSGQFVAEMGLKPMF